MKFNWKSCLFFFIFGVITIGPTIWLLYSKNNESFDPEIGSIRFDAPQNSGLKVGSELQVITAKVLDGHRFELRLSNGDWIIGHLTCISKEEASTIVVDVLNKVSTVPTVVLKRQIGS